METLSASEARTHFDEILLRAQRAPIQIIKNGKPVAVMLSIADYESFELLKLQLLKTRAMQAELDTKADDLIDGEPFFNALQAGYYD